MSAPYVGDLAVAGVWNDPGGTSYAAAGDNTWYIVPTAAEVVPAGPSSGFDLWCQLTTHGLVLLEQVEIVDFYVSNLNQADLNQVGGVTTNGDTSVLVLSPPGNIGPALGVYPAGTLFELWGTRNGTSVNPVTSPTFNITISQTYVPPGTGGIYVGTIAMQP